MASEEWLIAHRELQYLRAAARMRRKVPLSLEEKHRRSAYAELSLAQARPSNEGTPMTVTRVQDPVRVETASFPKTPGVYAVYSPDVESVLYVGRATTQTLRERWQRQHLYPRSGGSALRRSLGVHLALVQKKLQRPARYYPAEVEAEITTYLQQCRVAFRSLNDAEEIAMYEKRLIGALNPRLNIRR